MPGRALHSMRRFAALGAGLLVGLWLVVSAVATLVMLADDDLARRTAGTYGWWVESRMTPVVAFTIAACIASTWICPLGIAAGAYGILIERSQGRAWSLPLVAGLLHLIWLLFCLPMIFWKLTH